MQGIHEVGAANVEKKICASAGCVYLGVTVVPAAASMRAPLLTSGICDFPGDHLNGRRGWGGPMGCRVYPRGHTLHR